MEKNGEQGRGIDNDHRALRSSTIRGTRIEDRHGRDFRADPVEARPSGGNSGGGLVAPSLRLLQNTGGARRRIEGLPYGLLKGKALRGGKPLGEVFGFLRQINHGNNLAQSALNG